VDEAEEDVLGADVVVVEHASFFLRENNDSASSIGKALKHLGTSCGTGWIGLSLAGLALALPAQN
jgi:hypothetical protein